MGIEKFMEGQFLPTSEDIEKARREAIEKGEDPDAAEEAERKRWAQATGRLREKQAEEAIESAERELNKRRGH